MKIIRPVPKDYPALVEVWSRAVKATHHFLPQDYYDEIKRELPQSYFPAVELYAAPAEPGAGALPFAAFMGISPANGAEPAGLEMLFIDPLFHRRGMGSAMLNHARSLYGTLRIDVNEQNPGALAFYRKCGARVTGRSELDGQGKPYPLIHLILD